VRKLLIVAYHFPPLAESSGYLRSLKFCRYLPEFGWRPSVLTVNPRAYERTNPSQLSDVPPALNVNRVFALNAQRHFSFRNRYLRSTAIPDRWSSWSVVGIAAGWRIIRREHCDAILTTFPIATAVLIGWALHRLTRIPTRSADLEGVPLA
jgi:hypothetical protein